MSDRAKLSLVPPMRISDQTRNVFEDIRKTMGVGRCPANWRALAAYPLAMRYLWQRMRPVVNSRPFVREAELLAEQAKLDVAIWYQADWKPAQRSKLRRTLAALNYGGFQLLLQQAMLTRMLRGEIVGLDAPARKRLPGKFADVPMRPVSQAKAPPKVRRVFENISTTFSIPFVPFSYEVLAMSPEFLCQAWREVSTYRSTKAYQRLVVELAWLADEATSRLHPAVWVDPHELQKMLPKDDDLDGLNETLQHFSMLYPETMVQQTMLADVLAEPIPAHQ